MTPHELQVATSFLLGKTHGTILGILNSQSDRYNQVIALGKLELELRKDIERLYYPKEINSTPPNE